MVNCNWRPGWQGGTTGTCFRVIRAPVMQYSTPSFNFQGIHLIKMHVCLTHPSSLGSHLRYDHLLLHMFPPGFYPSSLQSYGAVWSLPWFRNWTDPFQVFGVSDEKRSVYHQTVNAKGDGWVLLKTLVARKRKVPNEIQCSESKRGAW